MSAAGSLKMRRTRGGLSIRVTGEAAKMLATVLAGQAWQAWQLTTRHQVRVRFVDEGQDVLEWDLDTHGQVVACRPCHAGIYVGCKVPYVPVPGDLINFARPGERKVISLRWPIEAVELRAEAS